jgi:polyisoprenoid-binding protein YceI
MQTRRIGVFAVVALLEVVACKDEPAAQRVAPPVAAAQPAVATASKFVVADKGTASFLIDAPLEKIKGRSSRLRGEITVDPSDLMTTRGEVDVDLMDLVTETFDDASKNSSQTGHAHNWLEIGDDVEVKPREENRFARFTIQGIGDASSKLADAPEKDGERKVTLTARGNLWVHGVSSPKTVKLVATFQGPPAAPTGLRVATVEPLTLSLKEHDIKPRDVAGNFLNGALEKVGKKIDDTVQISLDVTARPLAPSTAAAR